MRSGDPVQGELEGTATGVPFWDLRGVRRPGWRFALGLAVVLAGLSVLCHGAWQGWREWQQSHPAQSAAWTAGWVAALATALGTLPVYLTRAPSERTRDVMMGFGAGVMLAASVFSLIIPALNAAATQGHGPWPRSAIVGSGILLGAMMLMGIERILPPASAFLQPVGRASGRGHISGLRLRRVWLFVAAVALHNLPEGLAMGVAYGGADVASANALATGIALQDVPEGLVIASALMSAGYGRLWSAGLGAVSGVIEPVAALSAAALMAWSQWLLPWGLATAAGAMLFVISHEIIPETHRQGHEKEATTGLMLGFVLMMVLDTALG